MQVKNKHIKQFFFLEAKTRQEPLGLQTRPYLSEKLRSNPLFKSAMAEPRPNLRLAVFRALFRSLPKKAKGKRGPGM